MVPATAAASAPVEAVARNCRLVKLLLLIVNPFLYGMPVIHFGIGFVGDYYTVVPNETSTL